ncbi:hypothetical protein HYW46_03995 [Candidatus Daviesbacteria bacterium]|nr:hypothetical protein [Candidatus Daviesbacteria bacterium]
MNFKKLVFIIIIAILIGFATLYGIKIFSGGDRKLQIPQIIKQPSTSPTSTPKPTLPPIDQNSNLEGEMDKITPTDYSGDFSSLHQEASQL